jgi:hypothetical protein
MTRLTAQYPEDNSWQKWADCVVSFIRDNGNYFRNIIGYREQNSFQDFFIKYGTDFCIKKIHGAYRAKHDLPDNLYFSVELYSAGCIYMLQKWIDSNFSQSKKEMSMLIYENIPNIMREYITTRP